MNLMRWNPLHELEEVSARLHRFLPHREVPESHESEMIIAADWVPLVDISETEEAFHIDVELPDVNPEDVKVTIDHGVLTLQGERKEKRGEKAGKVHRVERAYGRFVRSFSLPGHVDHHHVKAGFKDGVLRLDLPKSPATPTTIDVKAA